MRRRRRRAFGESEGERRASNDSDPWQEVDLRWDSTHFKYGKTRPGHLVTEELGHVAADDGDNDSFASADDIGGLRVAFDDAIDNLTRFNHF